MSPLVMSVRVRGNPATLAARLPAIAATVDAGLLVRDAQPLSEWIRQRDMHLITAAGMWAVVTALVLFLSALGIFSLMSVSVSRRTREIGRARRARRQARAICSPESCRAPWCSWAVGSQPEVFCFCGSSRVVRPVEEITLYAGYLGVTSVVMLAACLLACIGPATRALRINPTEALREA